MELDAVLQALNAQRMVVAHTPTESKTVESRCNKKVFLIDVGISRFFRPWGGKRGALEILMDEDRETMVSAKAIFFDEQGVIQRKEPFARN
jgi:hypothetical protein